jgi:tetratricopeptide (TPR) repeat protein
MALVIIGLVVYVNCLSSEFIFDDLWFINNQTLDFHSLNWLAPVKDIPIKGRPLVGLSFVANFALCGPEPSGYHLFNMLIHVGCALTLFGVIRQAVLRWDREETTETAATGLAFGSALLWMIHPLQTECVNYVSQRTESMAAFFMLLSMYCAIRSYETLNRGRWILAVGAASWAAALCKEVAAVGPLLIVFLDFTFSKDSFRSVLSNRWRVYVATFSSWIPVASLLYLVPRTETIGASGDITVLQYALNQSVLLVQYLRLVFWPDALVIDYGRPSDVAWTATLPAVIAVLSLLALTFAVYRRHPSVGYLGLAGVLLLAPTSSVLPINSEVGAERRMYLPLAAIAVLVVLGMCGVVRHCCTWIERRELGSRSIRAGCATRPSTQVAIQSVLLAALVVPLAFRTVARNAEYADSLKLWTQAVEAYPKNSRAWSWLALEFSRVDLKTSERVTAEMARRWHDDTAILSDAAEAYLRLHHNNGAAAQCFRRIVELAPSDRETKLRLVWLLAGCTEDDVRNGPEAIRLATGMRSEYPDAPEVLDALSMAHAECGDFEAAIASVETAIAQVEASGGSPAVLLKRVDLYRQGQPFRWNET